MFSRWSKTFASTMVTCTLAISTATTHAGLVVHSDLKCVFDGTGVSGTFMLMSITTDRTYAVDPARAARHIHLASTFKIPNSLVAFDAGAVHDDQEMLPYGGKSQPYEQWEHDMVLPEAVRLSAVPIYQEVARRVGFERMQACVDAFDYDNRQLDSAIGQFWLRGPLEISTFEEARFTNRVTFKQLPVKPRTWDMVQHTLLIGQQGDVTLYAKTGVATEYQPEIGWWVDRAEHAGYVYAFTLNVDMPHEGDMAKRIPLDKQLVRTFEVWPIP